MRGKFPISFQIWNTEKEEVFIEKTGIFYYDKKGEFYKEKTVASLDHVPRINAWIKQFDKKKGAIGFMENPTPDFQNNRFLNIASIERSRHNNYLYNSDTLIVGSIYFAARFCIPANWDNDRDQFLYPNDGWASDTEFQNDCLVFTLFHGQNRISSSQGINHWIPFSEAEVGAQDAFKSHFMYDFIRGKRPKAEAASEGQLHLFGAKATRPHGEALTFSPEATAAMDAGRALWQYYHRQPGALPDASLYDIRLHFQGVKTNTSGKTKMNTDSPDATYTALIKTLRARIAALARKIEPKVYAYGFLK